MAKSTIMGRLLVASDCDTPEELAVFLGPLEPGESEPTAMEIYGITESEYQEAFRG